MHATGLIIFASIIGAILLIGFLKSWLVNTESLYLLAGRKTKLFPLVATLVMTEFNTSTLISFTSLGYRARWWAMTLPAIFIIGLLFYAITVAKKWKQFNGNSMSQFFILRYGKDVGYFVRVILFLAMAGFSATYIKSITLIFLPLFPINTWILSALLALFILLITWRGGLVAIIRTDIISFGIVLIFFPLLLVKAWYLPSLTTHSHPAMTLHQMQQVLPVKFVSSLVLLTMFSYILAPWYGQKIISAKSPGTAILAVTIAAFLIGLLYGLGVLSTSLLASKGIILTQADQALPYLIHKVFSPPLQSISYAALFLTTATTLSGVWSAMVTLLINHRDAEQSSHNNHLSWDIGLTGGCCLLSYLLSNLFVDQIFNQMIMANIPIVALSFTLLAGFYWQRVTKCGVYTSIIVGLGWGIGCYVYYGESHIYTWYWAIYGIPLIFIAGISGSLLTGPLWENLLIFGRAREMIKYLKQHSWKDAT